MTPARRKTDPPAGGDAGFVMLELVLALIVVSLIAALSLPRASEDSLAALRGKAMEVAALLRTDRNLALRSGRPVISLVDTNTRTVRSPETQRSIQIPARYGLAVSDGVLDGIRFEPGSRASGGEIRLATEIAQHRAGIVIRVDPSTAIVDVLDEERADGPAHDG